MERNLEGQRVLVLDDDYFAALEVKQIAEDLGATVLGPVGRLDQAVSLARAEPLDGAILDVRLDGNTSYSLARELLDAGVAVVFLTGYEAESIEEEFRDIPRIAKPYDATRDQRVLMRAFSTH